MKNQKRWIGIAALTGVTVIALAAGIIIKKNLSGDPAEVIKITEEGTNLGITQIETIKDSSGTISGYKATIETKGFGTEPIVMAVSFNAAADEVTGVEIISHSETEGLGAKITEEAFLSQFAGVKLPVLMEGMTVASTETAQEATTQETTATEAEATTLIDGTYEVVGEPASNGYTSQVSLTVSGGKITEVVWDSVDADGNKKSVLSKNGEYVMTENGPTWAEQAEALAAYVVENQGVDTIAVNDEGKTDTVASVSISVNEFVSQVKECLAQAAQTEAPVSLTLNDGTYNATGETASNGYTSEVSVTVEGGAITSVVWDAVNADGAKKSVQSMNGEYVMTENGPTWAAQAEALAAFVVEHQGVSEITMNEEGKTDAVASVSINVTDFVNLVQNCLTQAAGTNSEEASAETTPAPTEKAETSVDGTMVDAISGATVSTKAVLNAINDAADYLQRFVVE